MKYVSIDLSMRSTALVAMDDDGSINYKLVISDSKKINDEQLLMYNAIEIVDFINKHKPKYVGLEGLSFGSISGSKDIIAGNFWYVRTQIYQHCDVELEIIPVLTWRSPLFDKEERKTLKENDKLVKQLKKDMKEIKSKTEKSRILKENEELILKASIKYLTWEKLPVNIRNMFQEVGFTKGCFDLTDAYFIANHLRSKYAS